MKTILRVGFSQGHIIVVVRVAALVAAVVLSGTAAIAQHSRDSWKLKQFDLEHLDHSLAEAPLSIGERARIYEVIHADGVRTSSFTGVAPDQERATVISARVGFVHLSADGGRQILVQSPLAFCGAANCELSLFYSRGGRLHLALAQGGVGLIVKKTSSNGFRDISIPAHVSAFDTEYRDYRWDGQKYRQTDCYLTRYPRPDEPRGNDDQPPLIVACR